jgi:hypothetical protein
MLHGNRARNWPRVVAPEGPVRPVGRVRKHYPCRRSEHNVFCGRCATNDSQKMLLFLVFTSARDISGVSHKAFQSRNRVSWSLVVWQPLNRSPQNCPRRPQPSRSGEMGRVEESALRRLVFFGFNLGSEVESKFLEPAAQGLPRNAQPTGGLLLIPARRFQNAGQEEPVQSAVRLRVLVAVVGGQAQTEERRQVGVSPCGRRRRDRAAKLSRKGGQVSRQQGCAAGL